MEPKVRVSVVFPGGTSEEGTKFGIGRAELLRLIDSEGSLRRAVKRMEMSYRAAWEYVRELEAAAGFAFVERTGAGTSGGMRLTKEGRAFLAAFDAFRSRTDEAAAHEFEAAFGDRRRRTATRTSPESRRAPTE